MAKDPAMLWYWSDWHSGTVLMSRFFKGCYMDLLHAQFNHGPLSAEEVRAVLGGDFGQAWPSLSKKFKQTETGLFFNERLEQEKIKRKQFCESRKNNRTKTHVTTYEKDMSGHMDNVNENISRSKDFEESPRETFSPQFLVPAMAGHFVEIHPDYPMDQKTDFPALYEIAKKIQRWQKIPHGLIDDKSREIILLRWGELMIHASNDMHLSKYSISQINKHFQSVVQSFNNGSKANRANNGQRSGGKSAGANQLADDLREQLASYNTGPGSQDH